MSSPLHVGDVVRLSTESERLFVVDGMEKFNWETGAAEFAVVIAAALATGWTDLDNLDPKKDPKELYQIRVGIEDGFTVYIKYPSGTNIHGVNMQKNVGYLNAQRSPALIPNSDYEYWLLNGSYPAVNCVNNTAYPDTPRLYIEGWKYVLRPARTDDTAAIARFGIRPKWIEVGGIEPRGGS